MGDWIASHYFVSGRQNQHFLLLARPPPLRYQDFDVCEGFALSIILGAVAEGKWAVAFEEGGGHAKCEPAEGRLGEEVEVEEGGAVLFAEADL